MYTRRARCVRHANCAQTYYIIMVNTAHTVPQWWRGGGIEVGVERGPVAWCIKPKVYDIRTR